MIVYDNGRSGFLGEHSCMDGTTTLRMNEFVLASIAEGKFDLNLTKTHASPLPGVEELVFELDDKVLKAIKDSEARFDELVGKHDLEVMILNSPIFLLLYFSQSPPQKRYYTMMDSARNLQSNTKYLPIQLLN